MQQCALLFQKGTNSIQRNFSLFHHHAQRNDSLVDDTKTKTCSLFGYLHKPNEIQANGILPL